MYQEGEIRVCECERCGERFPDFTFVADTDMVTIGCVSLTAPGHRVALTEQRPGESMVEVEERIGAGFRSVPVRFTTSSTSKTSLSFQQLRKQYKPPVPIFSCIKCGGDSHVIRNESKEEFLRYGTIEVYEIS
jgi:DNA-directed RNA polymerase subunit M/transcription elongation factor TFIIS